MALTMIKLIVFLYSCQAFVEHVNIEGYWRTKKDILVPGIKRILEATNFREVLKLNDSLRRILFS